MWILEEESDEEERIEQQAAMIDLTKLLEALLVPTMIAVIGEIVFLPVRRKRRFHRRRAK
jgi:ABC-type uncharacterized transport system involved in gliding motility auxiliary subunit